MPETSQPTFEIYIDDDRYAVPTLVLVAARDEDAAREVMDRLMRETAHHRGAELYLEGKVLGRAGSYDPAPRRGPARSADNLADFRAGASPQANVSPR